MDCRNRLIHVHVPLMYFSDLADIMFSVNLLEKNQHAGVCEN